MRWRDRRRPESKGEIAVTHPVRRTGLERIVAGHRANQPGTEVWINPPGQREVSDMIWMVAQPLLASAPEYQSKEMVLKLTTLAWNSNYSPFGPEPQRGCRAQPRVSTHKR